MAGGQFLTELTHAAKTEALTGGADAAVDVNAGGPSGPAAAESVGTDESVVVPGGVANELFGHYSEAATPGVGRRPGAAASREAMDDFREVNGEHGRGAAPGADDAADAMADFKQVNGDADVGVKKQTAKPGAKSAPGAKGPAAEGPDGEAEGEGGHATGGGGDAGGDGGGGKGGGGGAGGGDDAGGASGRS